MKPPRSPDPPFPRIWGAWALSFQSHSTPQNRGFYDKGRREKRLLSRILPKSGLLRHLDGIVAGIHSRILPLKIGASTTSLAIMRVLRFRSHFTPQNRGFYDCPRHKCRVYQQLDRHFAYPPSER